MIFQMFTYLRVFPLLVRYSFFFFLMSSMRSYTRAIYFGLLDLQALFSMYHNVDLYTQLYKFVVPSRIQWQEDLRIPKKKFSGSSWLR